MNTTLIEKKHQLQSVLNAYKALCEKAIDYKVLLMWEQRYPEYAIELASLHCRLCLEKLRRLRYIY